MDLIRDIRLIYDNYASRPKSSSPRSVTASMCWKAPSIGADVITAPPAVIKGLFKHVLTDKGIEGFLADWAKTGQSIG
jgi:transaldolase